MEENLYSLFNKTFPHIQTYLRDHRVLHLKYDNNDCACIKKRRVNVRIARGISNKHRYRLENVIKNISTEAKLVYFWSVKRNTKETVNLSLSIMRNVCR